jgi:TatD DNase family protein
MWDAHCHVDDRRLEETREAVLERAWLAGVEGMIVAGVEPEGWARQRVLALRERGRIVVAYGVHPWVVARSEERAWRRMIGQLEGVLREGREEGIAVGVGEIGMDRSRRVGEDSWAAQESAFREQLAIARALDWPVVLHVVQAHAQVLSILRGDGVPASGGMVHGFSGSLEVAESYTALGLAISFGGGVMQPQARKVRYAAKMLDAEWLLCETDAPDMLPAPLAGQMVWNEPANLRFVLAELAFLRGVALQDLEAQTVENTKRLFSLCKSKR